MSIKTKTERLKLAIRNKPYWHKLHGGISLGYRRTAATGTWSVRIADGRGGGPIKRLAAADDHAEADGKNIMSFGEASEAALRFSRGEGEAPAVITTLEEAVKAYEEDLETRNGGRSNAARLKLHLSPAMLKRPVAMITPEEL